jgi:hypothetical protein
VYNNSVKYIGGNRRRANCGAVLLSLALLAILELVTGCNKSDAPTEIKAAGDPADPQYQLASLAFAVADSAITASIDLSFLLFQGRIGRGIFRDSAFTYHDASRYWYRSVTGGDTIRLNGRIVDTRAITITDSIQFMEGVYPVQYPDSFQLTQIQTGFKHDIVSDSSHAVLHLSHNLRMIGNAGAIWGKGTVSVNGGGGKLEGVVYRQGGWHGLTGDCTLNFEFNTLMDHVILNLGSFLDGSGCAQDGTITHSAVLDVKRYGMTSDSISGSWTLAREFMGSVESSVISNSSTYWQTTIGCSATASTSGYSYLTSQK